MPVKMIGKDIAADARRVFEAVRGGGIAIIHLDVGYAVLAHTADAVRRIYAAKRRGFDKPTASWAIMRCTQRCTSWARASARWCAG